MITKLKQLREERGLTQQSIAKQANITVMSYQRYEHGIRTPSATTAILIAKALDSSVEELFET